MENIHNFRGLAEGLRNKEGRQIKKNMIYRSGELSKASNDDIQKLINFNINTIYDLRSPYEQLNQLKHPHFEILNFNVSQSTSKKRMDPDFLIKLAQSDVEQFMISLYRDYLALSTVLKPLFQHIIHQRDPFMFHCSAGKDRTGIVGTLLMDLLDFDMSSIYKEYLQIDPRILEEAMNHQRSDGLSEEIINKIKPLSGIDPKYLDEFYKTIYKNYKTMDEYFQQFIGLSKDEILTFKNHYLE